MIRATVGILASQGGVKLLLDTYTGAEAAYSLRKLRSGYTGDAIEVRRASDNTTQDIGFVDGELDTTSLASFCSGTDGFVTTWYDQSGNGNDATQTTASDQPQIVSSGSVITDNGKPAIYSVANDRVLNLSISSLSNSNYLNSFFVSSPQSAPVSNSTSFQGFTYAGGGNSAFYGMSFTRETGAVNNEKFLMYFANPSNSSGRLGSSTYTHNAGEQLLHSLFMGVDGSSFYKNSSSIGIDLTNQITTTTDTSPSNTGSSNNDITLFKGYGGVTTIPSNYQEVIFYNSDQSSNRTGIETNINDFYSIYYVATNSEYQDVLDYADSQGYQRPSYAQQALQDALVGDLKDAGVWSKLDVFYVFATDGDSDFASINWKDPNSFECTEVNSPTFTQNKGFNSDGVSSYLDTNFNLSTDGTNYTQNDLGLIFAMSSFTDGSYTRAFGTAGNYLSYRHDNGRFWINSGTYMALSRVGDSNDQIMFGNRTSSTSVNGRATDLQTFTHNTASDTATSGSLVNDTMDVLRGGSVYFKANIASLFGLGSNLSTAEMEDVETAYYTNYFSNL